MLVVAGVLTRALVVPFGEQLERRRQDATRRQLESVRHALIGHIVTRGVLPCPLAAAGISGGSASIDVVDRPCRQGRGYVPGTALGIAGALDEAGALLDAWGRPLHYGVSLTSARRAGERGLPDWTTPGEAAAVGLSALDADLSLCSVASNGRCPRAALRADALAFVVLSTGADDSARDAQRENLDDDTQYALAPRSSVDGHRFDDLLVWGSRNELAYWLVRAEWLP